ncbi:hypothetical protein EV589_5115 [Mycobacterium sp. BK558]|nr:hypothetical protein EV589_5115 [Mycobacterium sp. BK558]
MADTIKTEKLSAASLSGPPQFLPFRARASFTGLGNLMASGSQ